MSHIADEVSEAWKREVSKVVTSTRHFYAVWQQATLNHSPSADELRRDFEAKFNAEAGDMPSPVRRQAKDVLSATTESHRCLM